MVKIPKGLSVASSHARQVFSYAQEEAAFAGAANKVGMHVETPLAGMGQTTHDLLLLAEREGAEAVKQAVTSVAKDARVAAGTERNVVGAVERDIKVSSEWVQGSSVEKLKNLTLGKFIYNKQNGTWHSPVGLVYGPDMKFGNRIKHVLAHAKPNPNKANHTVFNVGEEKILELVDEAWLKRTLPLPNDMGTYIVPMGKIIGTNGEKSIRIVVKPGSSEII